MTTSTRHPLRLRNINTQNVIIVRTTEFGGTITTPYLKMTTLNARSVKNKDQLLFQELADNSIDIWLITDTWLKNT